MLRALRLLQRELLEVDLARFGIEPDHPGGGLFVQRLLRLRWLQDHYSDWRAERSVSNASALMMYFSTELTDTP